MPDPLTVRCNCLIETDAIRHEVIDAMAAAGGVPTLRAAVRGAVGRFGNWVGGRAVVDHEGVAFETDALNRAFQADETDLFVPFAAVRDVRLGRMMRLFATVDVKTEAGLVRFRAVGRGNVRLRDAIAERAGLAGGCTPSP